MGEGCKRPHPYKYKKLKIKNRYNYKFIFIFYPVLDPTPGPVLQRQALFISKCFITFTKNFCINYSKKIFLFFFFQFCCIKKLFTILYKKIFLFGYNLYIIFTNNFVISKKFFIIIFCFFLSLFLLILICKKNKKISVI